MPMRGRTDGYLLERLFHTPDVTGRSWVLLADPDSVSTKPRERTRPPPNGSAFLLRGTKDEARSAPRRCVPRCSKC